LHCAGQSASVSITFARVALRKKLTPMAADGPRFQRFIAIPGRLTPHRNRPGDEMLTWFAFV